MKHGSQIKLANEAGLTPQRINNILLGRRNARPQLAKCLGRLTATDPFLWMAGGDPHVRQAATNNWAVLHASSMTQPGASVPEQL